MPLKKILLVDDSPPFNFLTRAILQDNHIHCQVDEVLNGQAALEYLSNTDECPDVILLDINMPVMDGFQFLEEYKRQKCVPNSKVFMLTSSDRVEDKERSLKNKLVLGYFDKPLSYDHIQHIITTFKDPVA